jgi:hypothetical protein
MPFLSTADNCIRSIIASTDSILPSSGKVWDLKEKTHFSWRLYD